MQPINIEFGNNVINDYCTSELTAIDIGKKYGVSKYVIYDILNGNTFNIDSLTLNKIKEISKYKSTKALKFIKSCSPIKR